MSVGSIWAAFIDYLKSFLRGFLNELSGGREPANVTEQAGEIVAEAVEAALLLIVRAGGITSPAAFLLAVKEIHDAEERNDSTTSDEKYLFAAGAIRVLWVRFGGSPDSPALQTVIDTFTALFHAPVKVQQIVPPNETRLLGSTPGPQGEDK